MRSLEVLYALGALDEQVQLLAATAAAVTCVVAGAAHVANRKFDGGDAYRAVHLSHAARGV